MEGGGEQGEGWRGGWGVRRESKRRGGGGGDWEGWRRRKKEGKGGEGNNKGGETGARRFLKEPFIFISFICFLEGGLYILKEDIIDVSIYPKWTVYWP